MAENDQFRQQVTLLIRVLPFVAEEECFALKGGTAINLFIRDLPRLSVDIDLTYLPVADRPTSLKEIEAALRRIADQIRKALPESRVQEATLEKDNTVSKLIVRVHRVQIKIEVTPVLRGCVYEPFVAGVSPRVEDQFGFAEVQVVSFADLYAGKIMAALDRQHPRDLFDVRDLLANEGIDDRLRTAFVVYLISHGRAISEVLSPNRKDISQEYEQHFVGMTEENVTLNELYEARERLIGEIVGKMPQSHRDFLISFKGGNPDWSLLEITDIDQLPAVQWKMQNLNAMAEEKRREMLDRLVSVLSE
tara:strand:+ start:2814 stop:3731 length:918 start_codon:yes stop_codon:yes gene_type:complete